MLPPRPTMLCFPALALVLGLQAEDRCPLTPLPDQLDADPETVRIGVAVDVAGSRIAVSYDEALLPTRSSEPFQGSVVILDPAPGGGFEVTEKIHGPYPGDKAFGYAIAFAGADELLVSDPTFCVSDCLPGAPAGTVFVYRQGPAGFEQVQSFQAPSPSPGDLFGVSLATDGDLLAVGSDGAAHVYERTASGWEHRAELTAPAPGERFGRNVDLAGGLLAVAQPSVDLSGAFPGAAHAFEMGASPERWSLVASFGPSPGDDHGAGFGFAVATDGSAVAVGAPRANLTLDPIAVGQKGGSLDSVQSGRVDVFEDAGGGWELSARLGDPAPEINAEFGAALTMGSGLLVAGAPAASGEAAASGTALVVQRRNGLWVPADELAPIALDGAQPVQSGDRFGEALAVDGDRLVAGAPGASLGGGSDGIAVLFDLAGEPCDPRRMLGAPGILSLELGGSQLFGLRGGGVADGGTYLVAGSLSGTDPGFVAQGLHVPLNPDAYLSASIQSANAGIFVSTLGALDAGGDGAAALSLPPNLDPALVGLELHHAAGFFAPSPPSLVLVTEAVRLRLTF